MKTIQFILLIFLYVSSPAHAELPSHTFSNSEQERLYQSLLQETRCVVCQSQSIGDSNSPFAMDMREKIYHLITENKNKNEINQYLVKRYGDFILLKPPVKTQTFLLWGFPFIFFTFLILMTLRSFVLHKKMKP